MESGCICVKPAPKLRSGVTHTGNTITNPSLIPAHALNAGNPIKEKPDISPFAQGAAGKQGDCKNRKNLIWQSLPDNPETVHRIRDTDWRGKVA
jgi:hypothetical protein